VDTNDGDNFESPRPDGAQQGGQPSLPPPAPPADAPLSPPLLTTIAPPSFSSQDGDPTATVVPAASVGKRSKGKVVGGLVAVVAVLGAGGFAVSKIVAGDDGGAASPTEVGTQLMDSLGSEDALGVVDLLLPGERETFRQPLIDFVDNLKRLEIVGSSASLDKVGGLDLAFDDVAVETTETNVGDISNIRVTANGTASIDGETVPIGDLLIDEAFGGDRPDLDAEPEASDIDWHLTTVERDGRWYLSAFYSIAESARSGSDDIPETGIVARGAESPDGAVQAIFDAVDDLDLEALIASLNPNEAEALQRYAPMFIGEAQDGVDDLDAKIQFSDTKFTVSGDGDRRTVAVDSFNMTASADGDEVSIESKDGCIVITSGDTTTDTCQVASTVDEAMGALGLDENEDLKSLVTTVQDAFADMNPVGITVQKVDGKWYVSPIGTMFDLVNSALSALDKDELTAIIDGVQKVSESLSTGDILFGGGGLGDIGNIDGTSDESIFGSDGDASDSGDIDTSGFEACFDEATFEGYSACLLAGIDDGTIDPVFVAPYYRFTECGVGEQYYTGEVYGMSDEEFTAFATAAAPCFQQYTSDGTLSAFELPYELSRPDCLEGKNWYNETDEDYSTRVFECATS
jgi:hypothetical protein